MLRIIFLQFIFNNGVIADRLYSPAELLLYKAPCNGSVRIAPAFTQYKVRFIVLQACLARFKLYIIFIYYIMSQIENSDLHSLGGDRKIMDKMNYFYEYHIEITIDLPRTVAFLKANTFRQKIMYARFWNAILYAFPKSWDEKEIKHCFEFCKSGQVHLHGVIKFNTNDNFYPSGLVSDLVKAFKELLPKKYSMYRECNLTYFDDDTSIVYKCPSIKLKLCVNRQERMNEWDEYLVKNKYLI